MIKKIFIILLFLGTIIQSNRGQDAFIPPLSDSVQVSLLTSYPWTEQVYAIFGHTSLRINDLKNERDIVFNYGLFDFDSNNFIYRFVKGETDYIVGATSFQRYLVEYDRKGIAVIEQTLNLTNDEKSDLWNAVIINCLPENRTYRYNFFYDNCATRVRDMVEKNVKGSVQYTPTNEEQSFRDLLDECTVNQLWTKFGIDLVIGSDADKPIADREKMFLPIYMMQAYDGAKIIYENDSVKELVLSQHPIMHADKLNLEQTKSTNYPLIVGIFLLIVTLIICIYSIKKDRPILRKIFSFLLFLVGGLGGCIIFFLMFFSIHPATNPNWNLVWLNPLQVIVALFFFFKFAKKPLYYYHFANFILLILFLLGWFIIPQKLEIAFIPYILSIIICSGAWICDNIKNRKLKK